MVSRSTLPSIGNKVVITDTSGNAVNVTSNALNISGSINSAYPSAGATQTNKVKSSGITAQAITAGTGVNIYTVTGGKTFFLMGVTMSTDNTALNQWELRDGSIAGTQLVSGVCAPNIAATGSPSQSVNFGPTGIPFTTNVFANVGTNCNIRYTLWGYEA